MKRFLLVLAFVAVAGATYVATAPGSQSSAPTARQFRALKKEVSGLKTQLKQVKLVVGAEAVLITDCMVVAKPVNQFGNGSTTGYQYVDPAVNGNAPVPTPALKYASPSDATAVWFTGGGAKCGTDLKSSLRHLRRLAGIR